MRHGPENAQSQSLSHESSLASLHATLVEAVARAQDRTAFAQLFDFYAPRLQAWLVRMRVDSARAEEVTQDVMVALWRKAGQYDRQKSSVATWLYRITRNRRIDLLRRDRVDFVDPLDYGLDLPDESRPNADSAIDAAQREKVLRDAMQDLPEAQLLLVRLAFFDSLSHGQIAERTGLPLGTVKSRLRLAFARLRRALEAQGVAEAS